MAALIFLAGMIWSSLSALSLVLTIISLISALLYQTGLASAVPRDWNATAFGVFLLQAISFGFAAFFLNKVLFARGIHGLREYQRFVYCFAW
jgi:hypothetical protein